MYVKKYVQLFVHLLVSSFTYVSSVYLANFPRCVCLSIHVYLISCIYASRTKQGSRKEKQCETADFQMTNGFPSILPA